MRCALLLLCGALAVAPACKSPAPPADDYGEAVSLTMEGAAAVPTYQVAYRARRPADPHAWVGAVAGLFHQAVKKCPQFVARRGGLPAAFELRLADGMVRAKSLLGEEDGLGCVTAAIDGQPAEDATSAAAELLVQVALPPAG